MLIGNRLTFWTAALLSLSGRERPHGSLRRDPRKDGTRLRSAHVSSLP